MHGGDQRVGRPDGSEQGLWCVEGSALKLRVDKDQHQKKIEINHHKSYGTDARNKD